MFKAINTALYIRIATAKISHVISTRKKNCLLLLYDYALEIPVNLIFLKKKMVTYKFFLSF